VVEIDKRIYDYFLLKII